MQNLQLIIQESKLAEKESKSILDRFSDYEKVAEQWKEKAKTLEVTSSEQKTEMAMAKEARKKFSQMRIDLDKARKELGEPAMRKWKAINAVANYLQSLINPIESYLKEQETFAEREAIRIEAEKQAKAEAEAEARRVAEEKLRQEKIDKYNDRRVELAKYSMFDVPEITTDTTDEDYKKITNDLKEKLENLQKVQAIQAEKERVFNERKLELAKYAMLGIPDNLVTIDTAEEDYTKILNSLKVKKISYDKEQAKIRKENEKLKLEQEKKERQLLLAKQKQEKLQAEIKAKKDAEEKAKRDQEEAEKKREREEAKKGDLEKFNSYVNKLLQIEAPQVTDTEIQKQLKEINSILINFTIKK